jgi:hypothetical protein
MPARKGHHDRSRRLSTSTRRTRIPRRSSLPSPLPRRAALHPLTQDLPGHAGAGLAAPDRAHAVPVVDGHLAGAGPLGRPGAPPRHLRSGAATPGPACRSPGGSVRHTGISGTAGRRLLTMWMPLSCRSGRRSESRCVCGALPTVIAITSAPSSPQTGHIAINSAPQPGSWIAATPWRSAAIHDQRIRPAAARRDPPQAGARAVARHGAGPAGSAPALATHQKLGLLRNAYRTT